MKQKSLLHRFKELSLWLLEHRGLWRSQPFLNQQMSWVNLHPELAGQLCNLSDSVFNAYEREAHLLPIKNSFWERLFEEETRLVKLETVTVSDWITRPKDIKARKWLQIHAFIQGALLSSGVSHWIDWCGGKGHLIRSFAAQRTVSGLVFERNSRLCESGKSLIQETDNICFCCADVLQDPLPMPSLSPNGIMALHACGQLTDKAIHYGLKCGLDVFALAPCCYHKQPNDWRPLSRPGQRMDIGLTKHSMRLPSLLEHNLRKRRRLLRQQQLIYRLAFQALFQLARQPAPVLPSFPRRFFYLDFEDFCAVVSDKVQIKLPSGLNYSCALEIGEQQANQARRLGMIHAPFRRGIELWINLDRAVYLAEQGLKVELKQFCDSSVTPRNMIIFAQRA